MKRTIDWTFGILCLLLGVGQGSWIAYNLLIEMQPQAKGKNPLPAMGLTLLFLYVGWTRIRKGMRKAERSEQP